jgi:hypothetical protein
MQNVFDARLSDQQHNLKRQYSFAHLNGCFDKIGEILIISILTSLENLNAQAFY